MIPDARWLAAALKLPPTTVAGVFLATLVLLLLNGLGVIPLAAFGALFPALVIIVMVVSGTLSLTALGAEIYKHVMERNKITALAARRQLRRSESDELRSRYEATVLARIDYLSEAELRYVTEALRKNEQSFTAFAESPHVANLRAKGFVYTPGGVYDMDHFPFCIVDFAWKALLARKDDLLAKDDDNKRKQREEEEQARRRRGY